MAEGRRHDGGPVHLRPRAGAGGIRGRDLRAAAVLLQGAGAAAVAGGARQLARDGIADLSRVQGVAQRAAARRSLGRLTAVDLFHGLTYGLSVSLQPSNLVACFIGVFVGTLIGVLPGIGPVATMSLLLPVTFAMSPTASIIMMAGIYYGAMYGGSTTSILVNIPGEAASVVTCIDGYQMARQGRAGPALGISGLGVKQGVVDTRIKGLMPTREDWRRSAGPIARGSVLGFLLGILPGIGAIIPTFISYALEKRIARQPERFGRGAIEGVAGPEAANNAATGGSMIPLLTLGFAPTVVMAVRLGAFLIRGVQPGPLLIKEHPEIFWGVITSMYVGNLMLLVLNLPLIGLWVQLLRVPYGILFPLILLFCVIGVYSESANVWDIVVMLAFGVIGLLMKRFGFEAAPLVLAFVLGRMAEESIRQSLLMSNGRFSILMTRPIATVLIAAALIVVALPVIVSPVRRLLRTVPPDDTA